MDSSEFTVLAPFYTVLPAVHASNQNTHGMRHVGDAFICTFMIMRHVGDAFICTFMITDI